MGEAPRVLLIGFGNPGRGDDGLGPAFAEAIEARGLSGVTVDSDYQLHVEDAARVAEHDLVVFVDADMAGPEPCFFERLTPGGVPSFSSHSVSPAAVLAMAEEHFGARVPGFLLGIRGYEFDGFDETISEKAGENLARALEFLEPMLRDPARRDVLFGGADVPGGSEEVPNAERNVASRYGGIQ